MKKVLLRCHWVLSSQLGIDIKKLLLSLRGLPRFITDLLRFRASYSGKIKLLPCLHDFWDEAGNTSNEYFWQDLIVAKMIFLAKPEVHVDIGSRVDGFIAHIASFREIEIFDIRPITSHIPGVIFKLADLMAPVQLENYCDSLSCLHALEHFGLGRYGDLVDPLGHESGLRNMSLLLRKGGCFYLSVPVGIERVEFNAHRVFDPRTIIDIAKSNRLLIQTLTLFTADKGLCSIEITPNNLTEISRLRYGLGIFTFIKT